MNDQTAPDGSIMLEVLVAFGIVSLVATSSLQIYGAGVRLISKSDETVAALVFAQSRLASLQGATALERRLETGVLPSGHEWVSQVRAIGSPSQDSSLQVQPFSIEIRVRSASQGALLVNLQSVVLQQVGETGTE